MELNNTSAARALHEAAEERDAGLLVVGSTDRGAVGRVLVGSTAERLMHGAPCPIAIVPHGWQAGAGLNTLGVAFVDTDEGHEALRGAYALARSAEAKLRVLTAVKPGVRTTYGEQQAGGDVQHGKGETEVEGELRVRAEGELRGAIAALGGDVAIESDVFVEDPADVLINVSQNLDLLVCGSRGYGPRRAVLLGGVSRRLAAEAHCPVIVLAARRGVAARGFDRRNGGVTVSRRGFGEFGPCIWLARAKVDVHSRGLRHRRSEVRILSGALRECLCRTGFAAGGDRGWVVTAVATGQQ